MIQVEEPALTVPSEDDARSAEIAAARIYYNEVAEDADEKFFLDAPLPSRSPYLRGAKMGRGAHYFEQFREFISEGGLATFKNSVVISVRMNHVGELNMNEETFSTNFFLDLAYWVPRFDRAHHEDPDTYGGPTGLQFAEFEPRFDFPDAASVHISSRTTEFSRDPTARRHESQLGQNAQTLLSRVQSKSRSNDPLGDTLFTKAPRSLQGWKKGDDLGVGEKSQKKQSRVASLVYARVGDKTSHWPRLWRTLVSDEELRQLDDLDKATRKKMEPSNGKPESMHPRLQELCTFLDVKREKDLSHPNEGIVFCTYDVTCFIRKVYSLQLFPYDFQDLRITVRLAKDLTDPLNRHIVPLAIDKAFFCSSRVPELTEWDITRNLDWNVERGAHGDPTRDGGRERLHAKVIVKRKVEYYNSHFFVIVFLVTTTSFSAFLFDAYGELSTRLAIIMSVLLTTVSFNIGASSIIPTVPYSTVLDGYINANFVANLLIGFLSTIFCLLAYDDNVKGNTSGDDGYPTYRWEDGCLYTPHFEGVVISTIFAIWLGANCKFFRDLNHMVDKAARVIEEDEQLGWMTYRKKKREVWQRDIRD